MISDQSAMKKLTRRIGCSLIRKDEIQRSICQVDQKRLFFFGCAEPLLQCAVHL